MGHYPAWTCGDCTKFSSRQCPFPKRSHIESPLLNCWKAPPFKGEGWGPETPESRFGARTETDNETAYDKEPIISVETIELTTSEPEHNCHNHCERCGKCEMDETFHIMPSTSVYRPENELVCDECQRQQQLESLPPCPACGMKNFRYHSESDTGYKTTVCKSCGADMNDYDWNPNE